MRLRPSKDGNSVDVCVEVGLNFSCWRCLVT